MVVIRHCLFGIGKTAVADFYCVSIEDLLGLLFLGTCLSMNARNVFATFVATLMLKGGLKQVFFRFLDLFFSLFLSLHVVSN